MTIAELHEGGYFAPIREVATTTATFDLLGFTLYWRRTRAGRWMPGFKTRTARLRRAITAVADWCRSHRHESVKEQHAALTRRIKGHYNYFGVTGICAVCSYSSTK
jgi:hypothetical protein